MKVNNVAVFVADDDEDDKTLILEALFENGINKEAVILTSDGEELLGNLRKQINRPCIVLLDLNMPRKDGRQTLLEIKNDGLLKHIPVIIFTTSSSTTDIIMCYKAGTNTYFTKPSDYQELVRLMGAIKHYWFDKAILAEYS